MKEVMLRVSIERMMKKKNYDASSSYIVNKEEYEEGYDAGYKRGKDRMKNKY